MMKNRYITKRKTLRNAGMMAIAFLATTVAVHAVDQPESTIAEGEQSMLCLSTDPDHLTCTTTETPNPRCPDDSAVGEPTYYWDYGDELHATADVDGTGTLAIYSDTEGRYAVTVFCEQEFEDANGNTYYEYTLVTGSGGGE